MTRHCSTAWSEGRGAIRLQLNFNARQEGRGIGLANKVAAYKLQDGGLDTVDANRHLGFDDDLRSYEAVEHILADMGIKVRSCFMGPEGRCAEKWFGVLQTAFSPIVLAACDV